MLIVFLVCLMGSFKAMVQGRFSRKNAKTTMDALFFNGLIFLFSALLFLKDAFGCSPGVLLYAAAFGCISTASQLFYLQAMAYGNVSLTMLIVNFAIVFPITLSAILYQERFTLLRILGIVLIAAALYLSTDRTQENKDTRKWLIFSLASALGNGGTTVTQTLFSHGAFAAETRAFIAWSYIFSTVLSVILLLLFHAKGHKLSFPVRPSVFAWALLPGILLASFQTLQTAALTRMDSSFYYPAVTGGSLVVTTLLGFLLLKDKLRPRQIWSVIIGITAIVLMNL